MRSDFIPVAELSELTAISIKTLYNGHSAGSGPLAPILCKLGGRLGCWRSDYESWVGKQRRMPTEAKQLSAAA